MIVEVIKGVEHSIELNFGESSVCITPDEAQKLIGQLRAVLPVPSDVEEAAKAYEDSLGYYECVNQWPSVGFAAGMLAERERLMNDAVEGRIEYVNGFATLDNVVLRPADFKPGEKVSVIIIKKEK